MITQEHEYYIRFILLLLQVGTDLLREITEKALQRKGQALGHFLNSAEPALLNDKHLTQVQKDTLYPPNPQVASINDFDITLLSHLLINYLNGFIDNNESYGVNDIRHLRNNYHAHATEAKMNIVTFTREWNCLATIIRYAGHGLSPEVQQRHIDMAESIEKDQLDITAVAEQIKKLDQSSVFFGNIQGCLDDMNRVQEQLVEAVENVQIIAKKTEVDVDNVKTIVQNTGVTVDALSKVAQHTDGAVAGVQNDVQEMKAILYKIKERTENQGRITKVVHTVYGIVYLSADEQETVDHAEAALIEASKNSIAKKEPTDLSHQALQDKVTQVLEDIENLDVQVVDVRKGSVVFEFKCFSLKAILDLIDYFYGSRFQRMLGEIANVLEEIIGKKVCIAAAKIDKQSIQDIITKMESKEYEKVVQFELSCTGVDGLLHALQAFEEGYVANSVNELSKALSESIGKPVTLHTSIDMDQMRYAIKSIQDQLDLKLSVKENYQDRLTKPDLLYSARNIKSIDPEHSEISGQSSQRFAPSFKEWDNQYDIDSSGTRYSKQDLRRLTEQADEASEYNTRYSSEQPLRKRRLKEHEDEESEYNTRYSSEQPLRRLTEQANISSPHQLNRFSLVYQKEIPVSDKYYAYGLISSCAILSRERLMIADWEGLSIVNIDTGRVEQKKTLDTWRSDIAVLPDDQVAVTLPCDDKIVILSTTDMSLISSISDDYLPFGITCHQDELYVVCYDKDPCVNILNLQGDLIRKLKCDEFTFSPYTRIAVSMGAQNLYITDSKSLIRYSSHGQVIARYLFTGTIPRTLTRLDDGSLLVVPAISERIRDIQTIHHISEDLQQGYELKLDEFFARFIGIDPVNNRIYVIFNDTIKVYIMHKQNSQKQSDYKLTFGTADEKLSSMKAKRKLLSLNTDEQLSSVKPDMKLTPLETDKKLTSYTAEKKLSPHQSEEKMETLDNF